MMERFHILGAGNIGCLIAFALRGLLQPPRVSLILPRIEAAEHFRKHYRSTIRVKRHGIMTPRKGYDIEVPLHDNSYSVPPTAPNFPISSLIVTTKAHQTVAALSPIKERLSRESTIVYIQNGMGMMEEVNEKIFPDPETRPNYITGVTTHGAHTVAPYSIVQQGFGNIQLAVVPRGRQARSQHISVDNLEPTTKYTMQTLLSCTELVVLYITYPELICLQLEKLAVNAVINPLTLLFNCYNRDLLDNEHIAALWRLILFETSKVVSAMPEVKDDPNTSLRFATDRLEQLARGIAKNTGSNISSMLQDAREGKKTEIEYINGYIVNKGAELGIPCAVNFTVRAMVQAHQSIDKLKLEQELPFEPLPKVG